MDSDESAAVEPETVARASMLRIARAWQAVGHVRQAVDAYSRLMARYPDSAEAAAAGRAILALAAAYERAGRLHLALDLYARLERRA